MASKTRYARLRGWLFALLVGLLLLPSYTPWDGESENVVSVTLNGMDAGILHSGEEAKECLLEARKAIGLEAGDLVYQEAALTWKSFSMLWGEVDTKESAAARMKEILKEGERKRVYSAYTIKIGTKTLNLKSTEEICALLQAALDQYEKEQEFIVTLERDTEREFHALRPKVVRREEAYADAREKNYFEAGVWAFLDSWEEAEETPEHRAFEDFELGLISMSFKEKIDIVEVSLPEEKLDDLDRAIEEVTVLNEVPLIYKVVSGDTLSEIALNNGIPMERLIEMNPETLENENSTIRVGDELTITVPEPVLSVVWEDRRHFEEDYDEPVEYVPNDDWYTNQTKTLQEPSAGHREVVARVVFENAEEESVVIEKEVVVMPAVAKIVERGTKIPASYIRPVAGGRISSGFGLRSRPTRGARTNHRGVDFAVPMGSAVVASCGGTVIKAGWSGGLGNSVTLSHPDGRTTVYGHLSKILVSTGQSVSQGQRIALSGNTGVSTGPHLHFGMTINGSYVNPLNYLN